MKMFFAMLAAAAVGFAVTLSVLPRPKGEPAAEAITCGTPYCNVG